MQFTFSKDKLVREVAGVVLFFASIYLALSLISYDSADPSFNSISSGTLNNFGGRAGAYFSDILFQTFGLAALILPAIFFIYAYNLIWNEGFNLTRGRVIAWIGLIFSFAGLMALWFNSSNLKGSAIAAGGIKGTIIPAGGVTGDLIAWLALRYMSPVGGFLILLTAIVISGMIAAHLSFKSIVEGTLNIPNRIFGGLNNIWTVRKELKKRLAESAPEKERFEKAHQTLPSIVVDAKAEVEEKPKKKVPVQEVLPISGIGYKLPPLNLLKEPEKSRVRVDKEAIFAKSRMLEKKLHDFGIEGRVSEVRPGPVIAMFEFEPAAGVKISSIASLSDDLAMALRAESIRIEAPIPGKGVVGIEVPNENRESVSLREIIECKAFQSSDSRLTIALGKDIAGNPYVVDLAKMPHLLVAGTTGSGKSVSVNSMITSILYKASPDDVKFIMVDPKMIELSPYDGIPHLLLPVVTDPKKAALALRWAVREMERRYTLLAELEVRNIESYNRKVEKDGKRPVVGGMNEGDVKYHERLPFIVVVIDELADLMMVAKKDVEESIARLAQKARASGIHLLVATQRPSTDVITGVIKANFPARIAFRVSSKVDSRVILDTNGAENLLGRGDMLIVPPGTSKMVRIHGANIEDEEVKGLATFLKKQGMPSYDVEILKSTEVDSTVTEGDDVDEMYGEAVRYVMEAGEASISKIQRKFKIGYNRAARIVEHMEEQGLLAPSDGTGRPRGVLKRV